MADLKKWKTEKQKSKTVMRTKTFMFLITYKCNLRCSYCYEPKEMSHIINVNQLKLLIRDNVDALPNDYDSFEIHFMGGEPLLKFDLIKEVSEWLWSEKFDKQLTMVYAPTNGTLLNDDIKEWCTVNKDRFCLGLSFDGDDTMQNVNRSNSSHSVDIDFFAGTWPRQSVKMTLSPDTIMGFTNGIKYLHEHGFNHVVADLARGNNIGWNKAHLKELSVQLNKLSLYYSATDNDNHLSMLDIDIYALRTDICNNFKSCSCGEDLSCIDIDGTAYACHLFSPIALLKEKAEASMSIDFSKYEDFQNKDCEKCMLNCLCNHCYGMNYICTDDIRKPDPFHCAAFKTIYIANCRHRLRMAMKHNNKEEISRIYKLINLISQNNEN